MLDGVDLAKAVLKAKDRYALLSLGSDGAPITVDSEGYLSVEDETVRKYYVKIASRIHPDKLRGFADATRAFQSLVRAYELCCKPDLRGDESDDSRDDDDEDADGAEEDDEDQEEAHGETRLAQQPKSSGAKKAANASSSKRKGSTSAASKPPPKPKAKKAKAPSKAAKEAAAAAPEHRTGVKCPRCHADWGSHLKGEGREALYTSFMQGQDQVHCLSCLFEFGALTAAHHCPFCARAFEFRPSMFGRALQCPNDKQSGIRKACGKAFRAACFTASRSKQAEEAERRKQEDDARKRREASKEARANRASRNKDDGDEDEWMAELGAFIVSEDCPRCGKTGFTSGHAAHLRACKGKGGKSGGKVAKKRGRDDDLSGWMVGRYSDKDGAYREPKKPKTAAKPKAKAAAKGRKQGK